MNKPAAEHTEIEFLGEQKYLGCDVQVFKYNGTEHFFDSAEYEIQGGRDWAEKIIMISILLDESNAAMAELGWKE